MKMFSQEHRSNTLCIMVRINPNNSTQQKPVESAKQYRQNSAAYAVIIKALNGILSKNVIDPDDGMEEFE